DHLSARIDHRATTVGVVAGEGEHARARNDHVSRSGDRAPKAHVVRTIENERAIHGNVTGEVAARASITQLKYAGGDTRRAGERVIPGENQCPRALVQQRTVPGDHSTISNSIRTIERQRAIVSYIAGDDAAGTP